MQCAAEHPPEPGRNIQEKHGKAMTVFPFGSEALEQDYPGVLVPSGFLCRALSVTRVTVLRD